MREPCIVCGHPTGDCVGSDDHIKVIGPGIYSNLRAEEMFVVKEDVFETIPISRFTTTRKLVARSGNAIPKSKAIELGLIAS